MYYELDSETLDWLEQALHLAAMVADLQRNSMDADEIYTLLAELAERFGLDTEQYSDTPANTVTPLRNFTVIHCDGPAVTDSESQTTEET